MSYGLSICLLLKWCATLLHPLPRQTEHKLRLEPRVIPRKLDRVGAK